MKMIFLLCIFIILFAGFVSASVCTDVPGCEGATSPRNYTGFWHNPPTSCSWIYPYTTDMFFDECRAGGEWYYYGPDDTGTVDGYVCYNCDELGKDCDVVRDLVNGNSKVVCTNCDCRNFLSGFPPLPCAPLTGDDCVDEKCCVEGDSFIDYRDEMTYTGNHGKYVSCVAQARKECDIIPSKDENDIQKSAAQSPTGKVVLNNPPETAWMGLVSLASIIALVVVTLNAFKKIKK